MRGVDIDTSRDLGREMEIKGGGGGKGCRILSFHQEKKNKKIGKDMNVYIRKKEHKTTP